MKRNRRRTGITLTAVILTTAILIAASALVSGIIKQTQRQAARMVVGDFQLHAEGYLEERSIYKNLPQVSRILAELKDLPLNAVSRRYGFGLLSAENHSAGVQFWGVDPDAERAAFDLPFHLESGRYLESRPNRSIVLGKKLASICQARVGTEIIAVVQAADGSLGNELFIVSGILAPVSESVDRTAAILHFADFQELFVSGQKVHEIALTYRNEEKNLELGDILRSLDIPLSVKSWRELLPGISGMINVLHVVNWIYRVILFFAAGLGILNTVLMSAYERIGEFGIMKALGTTPGGIILTVWSESLLLSLTGTGGGILIGIPLSLYLEKYGISLDLFSSGYTFSGIAVNQVWKASLGVTEVLLPVVLIWVLGTLAALYPAALAVKMGTRKAIQHV